MSTRTNVSTSTAQILALLSQGTIITLTVLLAPTAGYHLLRSYLKHQFNSNWSSQQIKTSIYYLRRKQFISYTGPKEKPTITLTTLGIQRAQKYAFKNLAIAPCTWDGLWRIVAFDIPESNKPARHAFRRKLKELGFYHFQRSVFVSPYPCKKGLKTVCDYHNISPYVHLFTAQRFDNDDKLIKKFKLNL